MKTNQRLIERPSGAYDITIEGYMTLAGLVMGGYFLWFTELNTVSQWVGFIAAFFMVFQPNKP